MQILIDGRDLHSLSPTLRIPSDRLLTEVEREIRESLVTVGRSVETWECLPTPQEKSTVGEIRLIRVRTVEGPDRTLALREYLSDFLADHWLRHGEIGARLKQNKPIDPESLATLIADWKLAIEAVGFLSSTTLSADDVTTALGDLADLLESGGKPDGLYTTLARLSSIAETWATELEPIGS